ncbi:DUF2065 domain-containing protein [Alloalcanivorax xenomutans]|uniref:DUF2065 domain-containing protein n=1 Tax=Alloalcanivorax xenomutans TaxID=1094342 RepID=UPI003D9BEDA1
MDWILLIKALCLVLVIEGLPLALAPERMRRAALELARLDGRILRFCGLVAMAVGAGILLLLRPGM